MHRLRRADLMRISIPLSPCAHTIHTEAWTVVASNRYLLIEINGTSVSVSMCQEVHTCAVDADLLYIHAVCRRRNGNGKSHMTTMLLVRCALYYIRGTGWRCTLWQCI